MAGTFQVWPEKPCYFCSKFGAGSIPGYGCIMGKGRVFSWKNRKEIKNNKRFQTSRGSLLITMDTALDGPLWGRAYSALQDSLSGIRGIKEPALLNSQ